jgi:hypothetical protein
VITACVPVLKNSRISSSSGLVIEHAQQMGAHESARTTKLYDRRNDKVTFDEVKKIML